MSRFAEHALQRRIHDFLEAHYECEVVAVPNGGLRTRSEGERLKAEGVQAGHPDLIVYAPGGRFKLVEVKTPTGRLNPAQKEFIPRLEELGHPTAIVRSLADAEDVATGLALPTRHPRAPLNTGGF